MLSIIGNALNKEIAEIEAGNCGKPAKKWLPVLINLVNSSSCEKAWLIAAENKYNKLDGRIYLARAILAALIMGEQDYSVRSVYIADSKKAIKKLHVDNYLVNELLRKYEIETPWATQKAGKYWPRSCFVHLTGLALYKLDNEVHAPEVMRLADGTDTFIKFADGSNVRKLLKGIDQIAERRTAVPTTTIRYTPDSKK